MWSKLIFFVLLCFCLYQCNGAPVGQNDKANTGARYTDKEDKFIVKEVSKLVDQYNSVYSKEMWSEIAKQHRQKLQLGTTGFPQERSPRSLCFHFVDVILKKYLHKGGELPKNLIERLSSLEQRKTDQGSKRFGKRSYTTQEDEAILAELLQPHCVNIFSVSTVESILAEFEKKRHEKVPGFENARTYNGLRSHLGDMKRKGQYPLEIMKKFWVLEEGASSASGSGSSSQNQQTDLQTSNEGQGTYDWAEDMVQELFNNTDVEVDFTKI